MKYNPPTCTDTAVCMCFFSPAGFKRPKDNFLNVKNLLNTAKIPTFIIECVIGNQIPLLKNPTVQVKSNTCLFYKEHLYNLLVPKIPEQYTKLIFLDGDILFDDPMWVDKISESLNTYDIVQPFENAYWMGLSYGSFLKNNKSIVYALKKGVTDIRELAVKYHHGFSFAMTRSYYNKIGGFFDKCLFGSGDSIFCNVFFQNPIYLTTITLIDREYIKWVENVRRVPCNVTYLPFTVYHMYHGTLDNRQYGSRYDRLQEYNDKLFDDLFYKNEFGVYETNDEKLKTIMYEYFLSRKEDDLPVFKNIFKLLK